MDNGVDGADDAVGPFRLVPGEVGQLAEDDVDADRADESHHHRVRDEPQHRAEPQEPGREHHHAGEHRQGEQGPRRVVRGGTAGTSAMMMAMAPVACTAMKAELVNNDPPIVPNRYAYRPASGLTPASRPAARPSGTLSTPSTKPATRVLAQRVSPHQDTDFHLWISCAVRSMITRPWPPYTAHGGR